MGERRGNVQKDLSCLFKKPSLTQDGLIKSRLINLHIHQEEAVRAVQHDQKQWIQCCNLNDCG